MKRIFSIIAYLLIVSLPFSSAQERKLVTGTVRNTADGNKPITDVNIYAYNTVAEAQDAYNSCKAAKESGGWFDPGLVVEAVPDGSGYFEIMVPETGALLFYTPLADPKLEKVNYRMQIDAKFNLSIQLDESVISVKGKTRDKIDHILPKGKDLIFPIDYSIEAIERKKNSRIILQSFILSEDLQDTLDFAKPIVYDTEEYHDTQLRRMAYRGSEDPIYAIAEKNIRLDEAEFWDTGTLSWKDTVSVEYSKTKNYLRWNLVVEDYNKVFFCDSGKFRTDRIVRPMQFLEYNAEQYNLDPQEYIKRPRRERRDAAGNISLTFLVGKAQLDPSDTLNAFYLNQLKSELHNVITGEGSTLKEFHIEGTASPDGTYAKNLDLANQRMAFALGQITSVLPKRVQERVYMTKKATVAPWTAVADLLESDSLKTEAAAVRAIAEKYPGNMDRQWGEIRSLPYYKSLISPRLPKLRSVSYTYVNEIYRELTPGEILERYRNDEDYRTGKKEFALYEYWHLFNLLKDDKELEDIYKRALKASIQAEAEPWPLPANNLAVMYLKKGVVDTTLLKPFIDEEKVVNQRWGNKIINQECIVANQVEMYMKAEAYHRASNLADMLPDSYNVLKSIALCMAGYFSDDPVVYNSVRNNSTQRNKVVMDLAVGRLNSALNALKGLMSQPMSKDDETVAKYLKVEILCNGSSPIDGNKYMDYDYWDIMECLMDCLNHDPKYIGIANRDQLVGEDFLKSAMDFYNHPDKWADMKADLELERELGMRK